MIPDLYSHSASPPPQGLAKSIAWDGEGATCLMEISVKGAASKADARTIAKSVAGSSLAKSAIFGHDPNWGRIAAAAGYSGGCRGCLQYRMPCCCCDGVRAAGCPVALQLGGSCCRGGHLACVCSAALGEQCKAMHAWPMPALLLPSLCSPAAQQHQPHQTPSLLQRLLTFTASHLASCQVTALHTDTRRRGHACPQVCSLTRTSWACSLAPSS
jgi:hypothetical protein